MMKTVCWSACLAVSICVIAYSTALYSIEEIKQTSFMMQACTKAGGDFAVVWGSPKCLRPKAQP